MRLQGKAWMQLKNKVLAAEPLCRYCGSPATVVDHIVPVALGGSNDIDNLAGACEPCNKIKRDKPLTPDLLAKLKDNGHRRIAWFSSDVFDHEFIKASFAGRGPYGYGKDGKVYTA